MNGLETLSLIRGLQGGGGSSTTYTAGNGIDITDSKISAKIDDSTIKFNSEGKMYSTGSVDLTRKDFTSSNVYIEQGHKDGSFFMTRGDETEDTLVWENGRIEFALGTHTELADGYTELYMIDYALEEESSEVFEFAETTVGQYTGLIWEVYDGIFSFKVKTSDGSEVVIATKDVSDKITHFEGTAWACPTVTLTSASGKLFDPIYPLPHDVRMDYAFDTPGYIKVGNKEIQIRDMTLVDDMKDLDYDDIYSFYDGENTIMYDFFRKDYSMIYGENKGNVDVELAITTNTNMTFGIYDQSTSFQMIEMGGYSTDVAYIEFKATWDSEQWTYIMHWYAKDKNRNIVWTSDEQTGYGPYGMFVKFTGKVDIWDCIKPTEATGTYYRFTVNNTVEYSKGEFYRDFRIDKSDSAYYVMFKYSANMGYDDRNYYMTNGRVSLVPNNQETGTLPVGYWNITWYDEGGGPLDSYTYDEHDSEHGRITNIELIREARGIRTIATYEDATIGYSGYSCDRDQYIYIKMEWLPRGTMPSELPELFSDYSMNCIFEKKHTIDIATSETYGAIKYDANTLTVNDAGQLYATPNIYTAGEGINISGNTISATGGGSYTAGTNIEIKDGTINYTNFTQKNNYKLVGRSNTAGNGIILGIIDSNYNYVYLEPSNTYTFEFEEGTFVLVTPAPEGDNIVWGASAQNYQLIDEAKGTSETINKIVTKIELTMEGQELSTTITYADGTAQRISCYLMFNYYYAWQAEILGIQFASGQYEKDYEGECYSTDNILPFSMSCGIGGSLSGIGLGVYVDDDTIKINSNGQLYTTTSSDVFMATYGTTTYADLKAAYDAGKHIYVNVNDTAASTNYYAALGKFIETTNTFFFPTTNYEGYLVQYFCSQSSGWGNEQIQFQPKLTAGTGISISADNVISATGGGSSEYFVATAGTTTFAEIKAAYDAGKPILCVNTSTNTMGTLIDYRVSGENHQVIFSSPQAFETTESKVSYINMDVLSNGVWSDFSNNLQNELTAGSGIDITDDVISVTGSDSKVELITHGDTTKTYDIIKGYIDAGKIVFCQVNDYASSGYNLLLRVDWWNDTTIQFTNTAYGGASTWSNAVQFRCNLTSSGWGDIQMIHIGAEVAESNKIKELEERIAKLEELLN